MKIPRWNAVFHRTMRYAWAKIEKTKEDRMLANSNAFLKNKNLIDCQWVDADSGETINVNNRATGEIIGTVPKSGKAETARAIEAAQKAFETFRKTSALERSKMLRKLHDLILQNQEELARPAGFSSARHRPLPAGQMGLLELLA